MLDHPFSRRSGSTATRSPPRGAPPPRGPSRAPRRRPPPPSSRWMTAPGAPSVPPPFTGTAQQTPQALAWTRAPQNHRLPAPPTHPAPRPDPLLFHVFGFVPPRELVLCSLARRRRPRSPPPHTRLQSSSADGASCFVVASGVEEVAGPRPPDPQRRPHRALRISTPPQSCRLCFGGQSPRPADVALVPCTPVAPLPRRRRRRGSGSCGRATASSRLRARSKVRQAPQGTIARAAE